MEAVKTRITPELAIQLLEANTLNRTLRDTRVERYAQDMKAGKWLLNGETIKITEDGQLLDGQHRLWAVIEANTPVDMLVVRGLDERVLHTIDTGAARTFADVAKIGGHTNTNLLAALTKIMFWWEQGARGKVSGTRATHSQLLEVLDSNKDMPTRVAEVGSLKKIRNMGSGSALCLIYTLVYRIAPLKAQTWLEILDSGTGEGVDVGHPLYQMRERMVANKAAHKNKMPAEEVAALYAKSWNLFVLGRTIRTLRWSVNEEFPVLLGPDGKPVGKQKKRRPR